VEAHEKMYEKRQYIVIQFRSACFVYTSAELSDSDNCSHTCCDCRDRSEVLSLKGDIFYEDRCSGQSEILEFFPSQNVQDQETSPAA